LITAIGIITIYITIKGTPTDAEIDAQAQEPIAGLKQNALNKHGITEEEVSVIEPIILGGYLSSAISRAGETLLAGGIGSAVKQAANLFKTAIKEDILIKVGKDRVVRTSICELTMFLFSEEQVFTYSVRYSLVSPMNNESTEEYYYKDFTSVTTESTSDGFHYLKLITANGESKSIPMNGVDENTMKSINAMKQMIRKKRA
jgi:hypothetical protein